MTTSWSTWWPSSGAPGAARHSSGTAPAGDGRSEGRRGLRTRAGTHSKWPLSCTPRGAAATASFVAARFNFFSFFLPRRLSREKGKRRLSCKSARSASKTSFVFICERFSFLLSASFSPALLLFVLSKHFLRALLLTVFGYRQVRGAARCMAPRDCYLARGAHGSTAHLAALCPYTSRVPCSCLYNLHLF